MSGKLSFDDATSVRDVLEDYRDAFGADPVIPEMCAKAIEAFSRILGERDEYKRVAENLCEQYSSYEEFDPLRSLLGLPLYFQLPPREHA